MDFIHHCIGNSHQKSLQSHQKLRRSSRVSRAAYNIEKWTVSQHFVKSQIRPLPLLAFLAFVNQTLFVRPLFREPRPLATSHLCFDANLMHQIDGV